MLSLKQWVLFVLVALSTMGHAGNIETSEICKPSLVNFYGINADIVTRAFSQALEDHKTAYGNDLDAPLITSVTVVKALTAVYREHLETLPRSTRVGYACANGCGSCEEGAWVTAKICICDVICLPSNLCCILGWAGAGLAAGGTSAPCIMCNPKALAIASVKSGSALPDCLFTGGLTLSSFAKIFCSWFKLNDSFENNPTVPLASEEHSAAFLHELLKKQMEINPYLKQELHPIVKDANDRMSESLKTMLTCPSIALIR